MKQKLLQKIEKGLEECLSRIQEEYGILWASLDCILEESVKCTVREYLVVSSILEREYLKQRWEMPDEVLDKMMWLAEHARLKKLYNETQQGNEKIELPTERKIIDELGERYDKFYVMQFKTLPSIVMFYN